MRRYRKFIHVVIVLLVLLCSSCSNDDQSSWSDENLQTVLIYMPWSTNLTNYFEQNLEDLEIAISNGALRNERLIVFFATSPDEATLFEIEFQKDKCVRSLLQEYSVSTFSTAQGVASLIKDVKAIAPARKYAMIVGSHAMGWLPVNAPYSLYSSQKEYWQYEDVPLTRYFGGLTSEYQIDISVFAEGIARSGTKMEYILFDDCYMSSIEVAYDLKNVTDYLIASPTEVMAYGFPYAEIGQYLFGEVNYAGIAEGFLSFYENYSMMPCGTIGITVCSELDNMATLMKEINLRHQFDEEKLSTLQPMDGHTPVIFFDFADYVSKLCSDAELLEQFYVQLEKTSPSKYCLSTRSYYSMSRGRVNIDTYSGITISDPSQNSKAKAKMETGWYMATH